MIRIIVPQNNINERKYIIDIIFGEFLGLNYEIILDENIKDYEIELQNSAKLIFEDHFFNKYPNNLEYLNEKNIPKKVEFVTNDYMVENDIPIIYGTTSPLITNHEPKSKITCSIDIFASSFYMLTRWEEYVNKIRDSHDRFPATESLAYKQGFLDRPIVNEYVEMLKNMLFHLDKNIKFKDRKFSLMPTHDVDRILKFPNLMMSIKTLVGDIVKRKSMKEFFRNLILYAKIKLNLAKDSFDTFDYLMDISEKIGVKSYFFFMGKGLTKYDNSYSSECSETSFIVNKIKQRGHHIGIHPTYNAYNDFLQLQKEKIELEKNLKTKIIFGREHFLRFEIPATWQIWEDNNMDWDSTCSYADKEGFRCGVCYEYSVFNILTRSKLKLKEIPLLVMEGSFKYQEYITPSEMQIKIDKLMNIVKKYNGNFVILWHNSSFNTFEWREYQHIYEKVLTKISGKNN